MEDKYTKWLDTQRFICPDCQVKTLDLYPKDLPVQLTTTFSCYHCVPMSTKVTTEFHKFYFDRHGRKP